MLGNVIDSGAGVRFCMQYGSKSLAYLKFTLFQNVCLSNSIYNDANPIRTSAIPRPTTLQPHLFATDTCTCPSPLILFQIKHTLNL